MKFDAEIIELYEMMDAAKQSKKSFIEFIHYLEIPRVCNWVSEWLETYWKDTYSTVFFEQFWNGSFDVTTLYLENGEELPSIIDDIERCIISMKN